MWLQASMYYRCLLGLPPRAGLRTVPGAFTGTNRPDQYQLEVTQASFGIVDPGSGTGQGRDRDGTGTRQGRDRDGTGTGPGRHRDGTGTGPGRDRDGTGTAPGRDRDGTGTAPGRHRDRTGTGLGPGEISVL